MAETAEPITMVKDGVEVVATDTGIVSALQNQGFDYKAEPVVEEEPEVKKTTRPRRNKSLLDKAKKAIRRKKLTKKEEK